MKWSYAIAAVLVVASPPALGDDATAVASRVMREALLERAPLPSTPPMLPGRATPSALTREQMAGGNVEAERAARRRAEKDAAVVGGVKPEGPNRGGMTPTMSGCSSTGSMNGCAEMMPADMMKSRGMMPGGGMMPSGGGMMPSGGGMMPSGGTSSGGGMSGTGGMSGSGMLRVTGASPASNPPEPAAGVRR